MLLFLLKNVFNVCILDNARHARSFKLFIGLSLMGEYCKTTCDFPFVPLVRFALYHKMIIIKIFGKCFYSIRRGSISVMFLTKLINECCIIQWLSKTLDIVLKCYSRVSLSYNHYFIIIYASLHSDFQ